MIRKASETKKEVRDKMRGGEGTVTIRHHFMQNEFGANVRLCASMTLPPGAGIGPHQHAGEDEVYIVTRGSGLLNDGVTTTRISAGDSILTGKGASHSVRNDGKDDLEMVALIACYPQTNKTCA